MPTEIAKLVVSLRRACKAGVWSAGVNLVRAGAVAVESRDDEEIVLRVRAQGRAVPAQVVLYPGEDEWDCDCPGRQRPCEHLGWTGAATRIVAAMEKTIAQKTVTYDFARLTEGATEVSCSEFATRIIANL